MSRIIPLALASALLVACVQAEAEDPAADAAQAAGQDRAALAMSAAPAEIGAGATLMDRDDSGALIPLRDGSNGWLCVTDENPAGPGEYPICLDGAWQTWFAAFQAGEAPEIDEIGISYMLQGGPAASNTDPMASAPPEGEDWLMDGPHLMIIVPDPAMLDAYPTEPRVGEPYVMWSGTPYAHLMVPSEAN